MKDHYGVVVIGGGNAGLCAALSSAMYGRKVLVLESAPRETRAGNSKYTRDIRYVHGRDDYSGGEYSREEFESDVLGVTGGETDRDLLEVVLSCSSAIPEWLERHGVLIHSALRGTLHLKRTNLFMLGGGKAMMNSYYRAASRLGVDVEYGSECVDLIIEGGTATAVAVKTTSGDRMITADSFVVASGGFEANMEWLRESWGKAADNFIIRGTRNNTGYVLRMLIEKGAATTGDQTQFHSVAVDARAPKYDGGLVTRIDSIPFGITVNSRGERFYDEGEDLWPKRYAIWGRLIAGQPEQTAYSIIDSVAKDLFLPTVFEPLTAGSIEEMADKIGIDRQALERTVLEYNSSVRRDCSFDPGSLDDCTTSGMTINKTHWALPVEQPPFYAYSLRPGITFTYFGVKVDSRARIMRSDGGTFENVFAAGEIMAGNILTRGYLAGFGLTIGTVFGVIAGKGAAESGKR